MDIRSEAGDKVNQVENEMGRIIAIGWSFLYRVEA